MKKMTRLLVGMLLCLPVQLHSQVVLGEAAKAAEKKTQKIQFTGGFIAEMNLSYFVHSGIEKGESDMKPGVSVGGFLNMGISRRFSVQGEMLFHYKESGFSWDKYTSRYQYGGVEIPIYAMYQHEFPQGNRIHIGIGPYTEFGFRATLKKDGVRHDLYQKNGENGLPALCDSNSGFGIKVGYEFASGFQINATYKSGVVNFLEANSGEAKLLPQTASVGIAYRFGK